MCMSSYTNKKEKAKHKSMEQESTKYPGKNKTLLDAWNEPNKNTVLVYYEILRYS